MHNLTPELFWPDYADDGDGLGMVLLEATAEMLAAEIALGLCPDLYTEVSHE